MKPNDGADAYGLVWGYRFAGARTAHHHRRRRRLLAVPAQGVRDECL
jgi:hypothetical protein